MLRRRVVPSSVGAMVLSGALAASPALGQVTLAHLVVTITPVGDNRSTDATLISFGGTKTYTVSVQNQGPSTAAGVRLTATLPSGTKLSSIDSTCRTPDGKFPCSLQTTGSPTGVIVDGTTASTRFTIALPAPDPYPSVCPPPNMLGPTSVQVTSTTQDPGPPTDSSASTINTVRPFADLAITLSGPSTAKQGDSIAYTVGVQNKGPCDSEFVRVRSSVPRTGGGILFQSNSGDCTSGYPCPFGTLVNGASKTFTSTYTVDTLPSDINSANIAVTVTVESVRPVGTPPVIVTATDDLILSNNTATARTVVPNSVGCSSTGGGLSIGLIAAVLRALTINRRRRA